MGQSVVVENRPGGNGSISVATLMAAPADGHTFIVQDGSIYAINLHIYAKMTYKADDLAPVAMIARAPLFLAAHQKVPVATLREFVDYVTANPGKLNYGSSGVGSTHHLSMEAIKASLSLTMTHVPFKGTGESVPALLGGHVDVAFAAYPNLSGAIGTNIRLLATNSATRSAMAPDVPPVADLIPGFDFAPSIGIYARSGTPPELIAKLAGEVAVLVKEAEIIRHFAAAGIEPAGAGPRSLRGGAPARERARRQDGPGGRHQAAVSPAHAPASFSHSSSLEHRHAELRRLAELRARARAGHHVVGLLRHRARDLGAEALGHRLGLVARHLFQGAGEHHGLAGDRGVASPAARRRGCARARSSRSTMPRLCSSRK